MYKIQKEFINFKIIKKIGTGESGTVYLASDKILKRKVAIKIYNGYSANDPATIIDFDAQVKKIAALDHVNIARIYSAGFLQNKTPYAIYEYVNGTSLSYDRLDNLSILGQIINGMSHAHKKNIIHGDLHKNNILIVDNETIKIIDFFGYYMSGSINNNEDKMIKTCYKLIDDELISFLDTEVTKNLKPTSTTEILVELYYLQEQLQRYRDQLHMDEAIVQYFINDWVSTIIRFPIFKIEKVLEYIENDIDYDRKDFSDQLQRRININISRIPNKQILQLKDDISKSNDILSIYKIFQVISFEYVFKDDFVQTNFLSNELSLRHK